MWLEGGVEEMALVDLLQFMWLSNRAGVLKVEGPQGTGVIHIKDGAITHAVAGERSGLEAVDEILRWGRGRFRFDTAGSIQKTHNFPLQGVILEATRQIDEWQEIRKVIPSLDCIPKIMEPLPPELDEIRIEPEEWRVLSQVDGERSLRSIVKRLGYSEFDGARILFRLARARLVQIIPPPKPGGPFKRFRR